ncbi:hypothetical protein LCGC14_3012650, partial [marine sediment metagenome]
VALGAIIILFTNSAYAMQSMDENTGLVGKIERQNADGSLKMIAAAYYVDADDPVGAQVPPGGVNDGVGKFLTTITTGPGPFICTTSLMADSPNVPLALIAAHCVTDDFGVFNLDTATVTFEGAAGDQVIGVKEAWTQIHPAWDGGFLCGDDIAIIELESFPTPDIDSYFIDRTIGDIGLMPEQVGFGASGVGITGDLLPPGIKRANSNTYGATSDPLDALMTGFFGLPACGVHTPTTRLVSDFDNGNVLNDANAFWGVGPPDAVGKGLDEGLSAGGDSGGPHFNDIKEIVGVTSYGITLIATVCPSAPGVVTDVTCALDSSFGEWAVDTRVASYAGFVDTAITTAEDFKQAVGGEMLPVDSTS